MKCFDATRIQTLHERFHRLYSTIGLHCFERMQMMVGRYGVGAEVAEPAPLWDQRDAILITYGDMVQAPDKRPLDTLHHFLVERLHGAVNTVHILPFFPYSSDDGFSVIDYYQVNPELGKWSDIEAIGRDFRLMVDLVLNHVSRQSRWFKDYVGGISPARHYFIELPANADTASVVRPRTSPLLTATQTRSGERHVWTTFSSDQMDLNFANADVLFEFLDILFFYISKGARAIRLDAIAYLWKKLGTSCIHLPETHEVVKLFRNVLDIVAPQVLLITETNVPHKENISYFGQGDEAHMVYQFTLPPLLLHALLTGDGRRLREWAAALPELPAGQTFFNFTASHDGIGVRPLEGILSTEEIQKVADAVQTRGGHVSTKANADGSESPYELNITYFDALRNPARKDEKLDVARFLCSQTIPLALRGIPGVYFNNLIGARNHALGVEKTGRARTINRQKWDAGGLMQSLDEKGSRESRVFSEYVRVLRLRARQAAFHPDGAQRILDLGDAVFAVERTSPDGAQTITAVSNLTDRRVALKLDDRVPALRGAGKFKDLLKSREFGKDGRTLNLAPYSTAWLARAAKE